MPLRIRVNNLGRRKINNKLVRRAASFILRKRGVKNGIIDITFVQDDRIKELNAGYMGRKWPTDVLSFLLERKKRGNEKRIIGDIYISSEMAYLNAKRFNTGFRDEIVLYVIHGVLHVLGFGDKTAKEKKKIRLLENKYLGEIKK
ncbi:MAG: rRNA maturation RNase YbeY [Candidatus Omnitrophica bacterium]|nr:rRNA maturation RNase YbeY [Candidatus Omnitrophota bacterium]